jgi:hypothetical protein
VTRDDIVLVFFVVVVPLVVVICLLGGRLFAAREKEKATVINVSDDVAHFWLGLEPPDQGDLQRRAKQAGWGLAEWLDHLYWVAYSDVVYGEETRPGVRVRNLKFEQPGEARDRELDRHFRELLLVSDRGLEPPKRSFRERLLRLLFAKG